MKRYLTSTLALALGTLALNSGYAQQPPVSNPANIPARPTPNPSNALDQVGREHNRVLPLMLRITTPNPENTRSRRWTIAVNEAKAANLRLTPRNYRGGIGARQVITADSATARLVRTELSRLNSELEAANSYAHAIEIILAAEQRTLASQFPSQPKNALLAAYSTARYSTHFTSLREMKSFDGGTSPAAMRLTWKRFWQKAVAVVEADFWGALEGGLEGAAKNPQDPLAGAIGGAIVGGCTNSAEAAGA